MSEASVHFTAPPDDESPIISADMERGLLKVVLAKPQLAEAIRYLPSEDFHYPAYAAFWRAIRRLADAGKPIGASAVAAEAHAEGEVFESLKAAQDVMHPLLDDFARPIVPLTQGFAGSLADQITQLAQRRRLAKIGNSIMGEAHYAPISTETDQIVGAAIDALVSAGGRNTKTSISIKEAAQQAYDEIAGLVPRPAMVSTGLTALDKRLGRLHAKELTILAGRPGCGKTSVAGGLALNAARLGHGVLFFNLEMSAVQVAKRMLCDAARHVGKKIYYETFRKPPDEIPRPVLKICADAALIIEDYPLVIDERAGLSMDQIAAKARAEAVNFRRNGKRLDLIIVDHLGLVEPDPSYRGMRVSEITEITKRLKQMAKQMDCPVIACCQLNRGTENRDDKRPMMSDLRDSGSIEQDADIIMLLYREAYYLKKKEATMDPHQFAEEMALVEHRLEIDCCKVRDGKTGMDMFDVDMGTSSVRDEGALQ